MGQRIVIDPVTRIEGHAKITIHLDDDGPGDRRPVPRDRVPRLREVLRGPALLGDAGITARICGICPVSHLLASAKAGDEILAVDIPPAADKLRRLMNLGQIVQSHALSFFHLSAPDLLLGLDSDPAKRNVFGLIAADPDLARGGHPPAPVRPGDHRAPGRPQDPPGLGGARRRAPALSGEARATDPAEAARSALPRPGPAIGLFKTLLDKHRDEAVRSSATSPACSWAWSAADGAWEHYDGKLRVRRSAGAVRRRPARPGDATPSSSARRWSPGPT